jgi:hypothetical protein
MSIRNLFVAACGAIVVLTACSSDDGTGGGGGKGNLQVFIVPEDSITEGLEPGTKEENIKDGWTVTYSKFLVSVGNFRAKSSRDGAEISDPTVYLLDLTKAPVGGYVTIDRKDVAAVRYDKVGEDMPVATAAAKKLGDIADADMKLMVDNGYSLYFEGSIEKPDGKSCKPGSTKPEDCKDAKKVTFKWGFAMGTSFDDCAPVDGDSGFAVPAGGSAQVKPTIHGDHWFFANITEGAEITERYAQYIADCDLDNNGETTFDELKAVKSSDVFPSPKYKLSGGVGGVPIATAFDYVKSQARTLHDYQGDGECATRGILK